MKVGRVIDDDSDFPNLWGRISYDESLLHPQTEEQRRLAKFVELDRQSMQLIDIEHERDVSQELTAIIAQMEQYQDYIESDDWHLIDDQGAKHPILCPVLREGGEIVWRWNPRV